MTWPRGAAVAEIGWSPAAARDWPGFAERMKPWMARYAGLGIPAADSAFRADPPPHPRRRASQELKTCSDKLVLSLEDDAPVRGERAVFLIDIMQPCWRWEGADLTGIGGLAVGVGQVPFNFQIGADREKIMLAKPRTPEGELEVRLTLRRRGHRLHPAEARGRQPGGDPAQDADPPCRPASATSASPSPARDRPDVGHRHGRAETGRGC